MNTSTTTCTYGGAMFWNSSTQKLSTSNPSNVTQFAFSTSTCNTIGTNGTTTTTTSTSTIATTTVTYTGTLSAGDVLIAFFLYLILTVTLIRMVIKSL